MKLLHHLVLAMARESPERPAVEDSRGVATYREVDRAANQVARALRQLGVRRGDRVGLMMRKSRRTVEAMQAALRVGAMYVPVDPLSPPARVKSIVENCSMRALITDRPLAEVPAARDMARISIDGNWAEFSWADVEKLSTEPVELEPVDEKSPAYILYTSGSTGIPKGVCISHLNALTFVDWVVRELELRSDDRLSNHAPFHFDLSVLDLYGAFSVGASVTLINDEVSQNPGELVRILQERRITVWYSVPSALILMMEYGGFFEARLGSLRVVLFAGEPFPMKHLGRLRRELSNPRMLNLYGPTETNVCTFYEVNGPVEGSSIPIGRQCCGDVVWAQKSDGSRAKVGEEGELIVSGPTVMLGYWGGPAQNDRPYSTGDIVRVLPGESYEYVGRRDQMIKIRGYRLELGDVEAAILAHPGIREVAVAVSGVGVDAELVAVVAPQEGATIHLLDLKRHCAARLPRYMIVDRIVETTELPRTRNGKVDRREVGRIAEAKERKPLAAGVG